MLGHKQILVAALACLAATCARREHGARNEEKDADRSVQERASTQTEDPVASSGPGVLRARNGMPRRGEGAIAALTEVLCSQHPEVRGEAALALGELGKDAEPSIPQLIVLLRDDAEYSTGWCLHANVNERVSTALAAIGTPAVDALVEALDDEDGRVRAYSARALGRIGRDSSPALPALTHRLEDSDGHARTEAALALWRITGKANQAIYPLAHMLEWDAADAFRAASALGEIGHEAAPVADLLIAGLHHTDKYARLESADALKAIGPGAECAVPALIDVVQKDAYVRRHALQALAAIGPEARPAVPILVDIIRRGRSDPRLTDDYVRKHVVERDKELGIQGIGPAEEVLETVVSVERQRLQDKATFEAITAAYALALIDPENQAGREALLDGVRGDNGYYSVLAAMGLATIEPGNAAAMDVLVSALEGPALGPAGRVTAAEALSRLGARTERVLSALERASQDEHSPEVRQASSRAIQELTGTPVDR